jgi:hypothetical protein
MSTRVIALPFFLEKNGASLIQKTDVQTIPENAIRVELGKSTRELFGSLQLRVGG